MPIDSAASLPTSQSATEESSLRPSIFARLAAMRYLSFSLIAHVILVIVAGSVVLVQHSEDTPDFASGEGLLTPGGDTTPQPPEPEKQIETASFKPPTPDAAPSDLSAITTAAAAPTKFQMSPAISTTKLDGKMPGAADIGKGLEGKMASLGSGGGMKGGTGFFGMRDNSNNKKNAGFVGTFYDMKQTKGRKPTDVDVNNFSQIISKYIEGGWKDSTLNEYYRAPKRLLTTQIFIPNMSANEGPKAFDVDKEVQPSRWLVHYEGRISPNKDGDYRFVGAGDDYLVVRLNGKVVLDHGFAKASGWKPDKFYNYGWTGVPNGFARGDKFHASASQFYDIDILVSERPGGLVFFCLMLEDQNVKYEQDGKGNPILPVFRVANMEMPKLEQGQTLPPYLPNGPVWKCENKAGSSSFDNFFKKPTASVP